MKYDESMSVAALCRSLDDLQSVRDSLKGRAVLLNRIAADNGVTLERSTSLLDRLRRDSAPDGWNDTDFRCDALESAFCLNWRKSGFPTFVLTDSMAALLALTRSPPVDMDHAPHPAFVIEVPKRFVPLESKRPTITIAVESYAAMGISEGAGSIGVIPDSDTTSRWASTGGAQHLDENLRAEPWMLVSIRVVANVIAYLNEHRPGTERVPQISKAGAAPVFEIRPPRDIAIDRAFRDAASTLVNAGNINAVRGVLSHYVRGHWRNQATGPGHSERRLTWVRPHRRGDESLGRVVERIERIK